MNWSVRVEAEGPGPYDADWAGDVLDLPILHGRGAAMTMARKNVSLTFDVVAEDAEAAAREGLRIFREALPTLEPVAVGVQTVEAQERQLAKSNVPELLGVAEIAEALGVSKQRVSELADQEGFPVPIARLRSGRVWQRSALARFMRSWTRSPGRKKVNR
jgi:hypothetical protein